MSDDASIKPLPKKSAKKKTYETINVSADTDGVSCDGGHPTLGHPKVWYSFGSGYFAACHYCSRIFIRDAK